MFPRVNFSFVECLAWSMFAFFQAWYWYLCISHFSTLVKSSCPQTSHYEVRFVTQNQFSFTNSPFIRGPQQTGYLTGQISCYMIWVWLNLRHYISFSLLLLSEFSIFAHSFFLKQSLIWAFCLFSLK